MFRLKMNIGFDAKRAFLNNTGLGNYSRNCINALSCTNLLLKYYLYSPYFKNNNRTRFMYNLDNTVHRHPQRIFDKIFIHLNSLINLITELNINPKYRK